MQPVKRHKRSGSTAAAVVSPSAVVPRFTKRYTAPRSYGKFQKVSNKPEKKNLDTDIVAAGLTQLGSLATATTYCLNLFNTGTNANQAQGRHVAMKSLMLRMSIQPVPPNAAGSALPTIVRVLVVYDRQPSGSLASSAAILGTTTYGTASPLNLGNSDRFSVLIDEKIPISGQAIVGAPAAYVTQLGPGYFLDRYVKVRLPTEASGSSFTGVIGGIATGSLVLLVWSDIAAAAEPPRLAAGMSRVRFTDA